MSQVIATITEEERKAIEESSNAYAPLDTYIHNVRGTEVEDDHLERFAMCVRLIMYDYTLGNLLASPNLGAYAQEKRQILEDIIAVHQECKHTERRANQRLQVLLQHRIGRK